jgi:hypothetical protein
VIATVPRGEYALPWGLGESKSGAGLLATWFISAGMLTKGIRMLLMILRNLSEKK